MNYLAAAKRGQLLLSVETHELKANHRLPLPYIAALSGLLAAVCALSVLAAVALVQGSSNWWGFSLFFLAPASAVAVVVMIIAGEVTHGIINVFGLTNRWIYVGGTLLIIGGCYVFLFGLHDAFRDPVGSLAFLVPIAAIPGGLLFHYLAQEQRFITPFDRRDSLIIATWIAAWVLALACAHYVVPAVTDPYYARSEIVRIATRAGTGAFMFCGIIAGFARLRSVHLGFAIAAVSWLIPAALSVAYFATPLGPQIVPMKAGSKTFEFNWWLDPRPEKVGFSFNSSDQGPYQFAGRKQINRRIYVAEAGNTSLMPTAWGCTAQQPCERAFGLLCDEGNASRKSLRVCILQNANGPVTTAIECWSGYCFHRFDDGGLRYSLHIDPADISTWEMIQSSVSKLVHEHSQ